MVRPHRFYLPGHTWHLTHRCHKREFLFRFARDRRRWMHWLFEAKKRYGLQVLNYVVTSNHIHLLVHGSGNRMAIPRAMQLMAGRVAQEYNARKHRQGAFWEDRYHATAVENGTHLRRCMTYIDLNMVRAGVVRHPSEWSFGGYHELERRPKRYGRIDRSLLVQLAGLSNQEELSAWRRERVDAAIRERGSLLSREYYWSEKLALGSPAYIARVKREFGIDVDACRIEEAEECATLREARGAYDIFSDDGIEALSAGNRLRWDVSPSQ
ncbi:transposase [Kiritimatiella glycovorans]|uniref:Transposase n=1 Tax=Kiritimatiella glycovorans TaxID=1307763 RepID=A0A0G3EFW5_9BACT|nr:transposase [Kiritimatiella glycovorans]AKJ65306.1 Transposasec [Kiritimatiella glycovorans]AKJ65640.1 Transposase [Kiritimatiella glycovorans]